MDKKTIQILAGVLGAIWLVLIYFYLVKKKKIGLVDIDSFDGYHGRGRGGSRTLIVPTPVYASPLPIATYEIEGEKDKKIRELEEQIKSQQSKY